MMERIDDHRREARRATTVEPDARPRNLPRDPIRQPYPAHESRINRCGGGDRAARVLPRPSSGRIVLASMVLAAFVPVGGALHAGEAESACEVATRTLTEGRADEAAGMFAELLEESDCDECSVAGRVAALIELDRWGEALDVARVCHEHHPGRTGLSGLLGEALYRAGRLAESEALLSGLATVEGLRGSSLSVLGLLRAARGRSEEAIEIMDRALAIAPSDRRVLFRAAEATTTREESLQRLTRYLELSAGDDPDRIEAAKGTLRTLRALGDRQVWVPVERPERVELPLTMLAIHGGRVGGAVVKVAIGEKRKPVRLLLDSGSSGLFLVGRIARKRGFEPVAEETTFGGGGDKRHASSRGLFPFFDVGGLSFSNALATTTESEFDSTGRFHGVLGLSIFDGYLVTINLARGRLILQAARDEAPAGVDYWTVAGQMLVGAGAEGGPEGLFLFDTGASTSVLDVGYAREVPEVELIDGAYVRGYGGQVAGATIVRGARLTLASFDTGPDDLRATDLTLRSRLGGVQLSGYLGLDLLGGKRLVIDTEMRRLRVEKPD
jgi:tetratricopeptide (TPR) repeat protein